MNLREARKQRKLSQWKLAKFSGVHQSRISLFENDLAVPRSEEVKALGDALNIAPWRLELPK